ncbi:MAG: DUF1573 domain-containing protein [Cytophagales bacterium]|nr:DUF1573 domain-containing protein [Cytophaga sp.]
MKTYFLLAFSILSSISLFAQADVKGPFMSFDQLSHDFGNVMEGDVVSYTFTYKNTGTDTLRIDQIASSCGCTVPSNYDHVVAPGKTSKIEVQFNSSNKSGITNKTLTILSNAVTKEPAILLSIRANVIPKK